MEYLKKAKELVLGEEIIFKADQLNSKLHADFREAVPLKKARVGTKKSYTWRYLDYGDPNKIPLICIPPAGGSADVFFKLMNKLPGRGIRVIAVQNPEVSDHNDWIESFSLFLEYLHIPKMHLLGCGLGGFLSILYASNPKTTKFETLSLILINTYAANGTLAESPVKYELLPAVVLKNYMARNFQEVGSEVNLASVAFFLKHMNDLTQAELFSNLNLEILEARFGTQRVNQQTTTIILSTDFLSLPTSATDSVTKAFPNARLVLLKNGGDFPFISESEEVALHVVVHMRRLDPSLMPVLATSSGSASASALPGLSEAAVAVSTSPEKDGDVDNSTEKNVDEIDPDKPSSSSSPKLSSAFPFFTPTSASPPATAASPPVSEPSPGLDQSPASSGPSSSSSSSSSSSVTSDPLSSSGGFDSVPSGGSDPLGTSEDWEWYVGKSKKKKKKKKKKGIELM